MPLANLTFLFYCFPAVVIAYFAFFFSKKAQNIVLLIGSLAFYALGQTIYVVLLVLVIAANWLFGLWINAKRGKNGLVFALSCAFNVAVLLLFKYAPVMYAQFGGAAVAGSLQFVLPIGMSLYILQAISYCADVYKGFIRAEKNILHLGLYLAFFPKMVAGPIMGYANFLTALGARHTNFETAYKGFARFITGLGKTVIIAQPFAALAHHIFIWSAMGRFQVEISVLTAWIGAISLMFQLYFELSGYADMAIGLAKIFGITIPENFDRPFSATTVTGFWSRFNSTVIGWFRIYISRPLNRVAANKDMQVRNNLTTWLLLGLWYETGWSFILFGLWFFLLTLAEDFFGIQELAHTSFLRFIYTQTAVMVGWVMLKTENIYQMGRFLMNLVGVNINPLVDNTAFVLLKENWIWFIIAMALVCAPFRKAVWKIKNHPKTAVAAVYMVAQAVAVLGILLFSVLILLQTSTSYSFYL